LVVFLGGVAWWCCLVVLLGGVAWYCCCLALLLLDIVCFLLQQCCLVLQLGIVAGVAA